MSTDKIVLIAYALFLAAGGLMGFKAGSKVSLIMGLISGALVLLGVYLIGTTPRAGWALTVVVNGILVAVFIKRFLATGMFMPSGLLLLASFLMTIFCIVRLMKG